LQQKTKGLAPLIQQWIFYSICQLVQNVMAPGGLVFAEEFPFQVLLFQLGRLHSRFPRLLLLPGGLCIFILRQLLTRIICRGGGGSLLPANVLLTPLENK
jgi:hypothetical protein